MDNSVKLEDIEQYRLQMVAISTAAFGYWTEEEGIKPEYDTVPLRDVAKLYAKYAALHESQATKVQAVPEGVSREDIEKAIRQTEYKYFGDYEFSEGQRHAVDVLVKCAQSILAAPTAQEVTQQAAKAETAEQAPSAKVIINDGNGTATIMLAPGADLKVGMSLYIAPTTSTVSAPDEIRNAAIVEVAEHFDPSATQVITERDAYRRILALRTVSTAGAQNAEAIRNQATTEVRFFDRKDVSRVYNVARMCTHDVPDEALDDMRDVLLAAIQSGTASTKTGGA